MKLDRKKLRRLIKESILNEEDSSQLDAFMDFAQDAQKEIESILETYDKFLDMADQHAEKLGFSNDAARDFIKGRLEDLAKKVSNLPFA